MIRLKMQTFLCFLILSVSHLGFGAESSPRLTVASAGANLYAREDIESKIVATLKKGEMLKPLAQGVGVATWYMVRTSNGVIGWVHASNVTSGKTVDEIFRDSTKIGPSATAYGQDNHIGVDVTPKAQVEANKENDKREAEGIRSAEIRAEQEQQRNAEFQKAQIQARAAIEAAGIQAQGEAEAAKNKKPDVCLLCNWQR